MITVPNKNADDSHSEEPEVMPEKKVDAVEEGVQGPMMRKREGEEATVERESEHPREVVVEKADEGVEDRVERKVEVEEE